MTATARKRNVVEWAAFGLGTALTISIIAFLGWEAASGTGSVNLEVRIVDVSASPGRAEATVRVRNRGGAAAQDVDIEVCDATNSCVPASFDQVAAGAVAEHVVRFEPGSGPFSIRVLGWRVGQ